MLQAVIFKLLLALILGGLIGYEREHMSRPAGLRTHVLVCVGAALVQITSIGFYAQYHGTFNTDPMRMGAQVISGIGFLGAGTILKEGTSIKGLTTAASLWTVACIGLTVGSGLYMEAITATLFIYLTLKGLRKFEGLISKNKKSVTLQVVSKDSPGIIGKIGDIFGSLNINVINVEIQNNNDDMVNIEWVLKSSIAIPLTDVLDKVSALDGIKNVRLI